MPGSNYGKVAVTEPAGLLNPPKAGRGPFTYLWSGVLSGSSNVVSGQVPTSGWLSLQVWCA